MLGVKQPCPTPGKLTYAQVPSWPSGQSLSYTDDLQPQLSKDGGRWGHDPPASLISQSTCHLETKPPLFTFGVEKTWA